MEKERDYNETMTQVWLRNSSGAPRNLLLIAVGTWQPNNCLLWVIYLTYFRLDIQSANERFIRPI